MAATLQWVLPRLDSPVLKSLGFTTAADESTASTPLPKELWQECVEDPLHTFRELVRESEFLTPKDRGAIAMFDEPCARVAAALVAHWLERWVIPTNEILIDLPHLASAYPWLLMSKGDIECWQATTSLENGFDALVPGVHQHEFRPGFPLPRPVVWRHAVLADARLAEPKGFTYDAFPDLVFCEDTSRFQLFEHSRAFSCRLPGGDPQRFVAHPERVVPINGGQPLTGVLYEPSVFFAV
jgi:hypothetical protein